jgi:hypothetical protein
MDPILFYFYGDDFPFIIGFIFFDEYGKSLPKGVFFLKLVKKKDFQIKLTKPLAINKKEGIHNKKTGRENGIDKINNPAETRSTALKASPPKINNPLNKRRTAEKITMGIKTGIPKVNIKKTIAANRSKPPNNLTIIHNL